MRTVLFRCFIFTFSVVYLAASLQALQYQRRKAIVIGASSGIGRNLAVQLSEHGYDVGLVARREALLESVGKRLKGNVYIKNIDVAQVDTARKGLRELINEMGSVDLIVLNAGVGYRDLDFEWKKERLMLQVNVVGFAALAQVALEYFKRQKKGHLVGISSVAGVRGMPGGSIYSGTKAFVQKYLESVRVTLAMQKYRDIFITDIRPGYVDTDMAKGKTFWMITAKQAAEQIYDAIQAKKKVAYVSNRWWFVAQVLKFLPDWVFSYFCS